MAERSTIDTSRAADLAPGAELRDQMDGAIAAEREATRQVASAAASATAGPGEAVGGPGVRKVTGTPQRLLSRDPNAFAVPTGREEEWRFTPMRRLRRLSAALEAGATPGANGDQAMGRPEVTAQLHGATAERVPMKDPRVGRALVPGDRLTALSMAEAADALLVSVPVEEVDAAVHLAVRGRGDVGAGHVVIDVGRHASATIVLDHTGGGAYALNVEVLTGDGSQVTVVSVQDWDDDAVHLGAHALRVGRDARLRHVVVTLGGDLVRLLPTVTYAGPGGDAQLFGLHFADAGQHQEHRLFVDHAVPSCRSRVTYKGALRGAGAHGVWIGDVLIRAAATDTDTYELNRNLVLSDGARADSVPNLEIETGEVTGAGHASATGRFDDEALFYLMARGIPADEARRLVVRGFFAEIIEQLPAPELRERVEAAVEAELSADEPAGGTTTDGLSNDEMVPA